VHNTAERGNVIMQVVAARVALALCVALAGSSQARDGPVDPQEPKRAKPVPAVMYIPTPHDVVREMLNLAGVEPSDRVYDLGCGDGRIVVMAAKQHGCSAVGVDIDPLRVQDARQNVKKGYVEHLVTIEQGDLFKVDLSEATVVTLYLSTKYNTNLIPQLSRMKPGSRIVSHLFGIKGVKPHKVVLLDSQEDPHKHTLYLWTTPLEGR
jgi:SAM-dependent methyltransferase